MRTLIPLAIAVLAVTAVDAQTCPTKDEHGPVEASRDSILHGTLLLHDELRQWLGIKLDQPACGQTEVELIFSEAKTRREAETLRGCTVTATGRLFDSPTGYYSANMAISDPTLKPDLSCHPFPVKRDQHPVPIPPTLKAYHASISVDYRGKGHIYVKVWEGEDNPVPLAPWETYVDYILTGSRDVIWFNCQKGFQIKDITQTPENPDGVIVDIPRLTGTVLQDINGVNVVKFTCRRSR